MSKVYIHRHQTFLVSEGAKDQGKEEKEKRDVTRGCLSGEEMTSFPKTGWGV